MFRNVKLILKCFNAIMLILASFASTFGDWMFATVLNVILYNNGDLKTLAIVTSFRFSCMIFLLPLGGAIVEKLPKKSVMIISDFLRFVIMGIITLLLFFNVKSSFFIAILSCTSSVVSIFFSPSRRALLPKVVEENKRNAFNSLDGTIGTLTLTLAPAIAGILMLKFPNWFIVFLNSISFLFSGLCIILINFKEKEINIVDKKLETNINFLIKWWGEIKEGALEIIKNPSVLFVTSLGISTHIAVGTTWIIIPILAHKLSYLGVNVGYLSSCIGIGSVVGMIIGGNSKSKNFFKYSFMAVFSLAIVLALLASPVINNLGVYILMILLGLFANIFEPICWSLLQNKTPIEKYSRVFSTFDALTLFGVLIGTNSSSFFSGANQVYHSIILSVLLMVIFLILSSLIWFNFSEKKL